MTSIEPAHAESLITIVDILGYRFKYESAAVPFYTCGWVYFWFLELVGSTDSWFWLAIIRTSSFTSLRIRKPLSSAGLIRAVLHPGIFSTLILSMYLLFSLRPSHTEFGIEAFFLSYLAIIIARPGMQFHNY